MQAFLDKTADYIFKNYKDRLYDLSVILPNRRAALFLGKYLASKSDKPIFSPAFYSIEDFVFKLSGFQSLPLLDQLFELYAVHQQIEGADAHSFDRFNGWGQLLLKDFNDIDLYLKDAGYVFRYLSEAKAISLWKLDPSEMSNMERQYLAFYGRLGDYYRRFTKRLRDKNFACQGLAYRYVAENIASLDQSGKPVLFVGFNALSPSEQNIFDYYEEEGRAKILWDIDPYYFDDPQQEAGDFLRKQLQNKDPKSIDWISNNLSTDEKEVNVYGLSGDVSLAKMAGNILEDLSKEKGKSPGDETAVVLANENLAIPLLYSLPQSVENVNITMSFPVRLSRVFELVMNTLDLFSLQSGSGEDTQKGFYHKHFESMLMHPLIISFAEKHSCSGLFQEMLKAIKTENISFIKTDFLNEYKPNGTGQNCELLELIMQEVSDIPSLLQTLIRLMDMIYEATESDIDREFLYFYLAQSRRLLDLLEQNPYINEVNTLRKLFISIANTGGVPFYGEPLRGLQIMGLLETRTLDFENLILLSANEGMMPKSHVYQSFILPDIKRELGLPMPGDNDSVFAYHFYRLLQRAKRIFILYNTQHDSMGRGELSRYVQQLEWEWQKKNPRIRWNHKMFHIPLSTEEYDTTIRFPKDDFALQRLEKIAGKGFSPSTLNTYKQCRLKFYFQRILELYTEEEVEETMEANTLGTVIHDMLEYYYKSIRGELITGEFLEKLKAGYKTKLRDFFANTFKQGDIDHGFNRLLFEVAVRFVEYFINREEEMLRAGHKCRIIALEQELERELLVNLNDKSLNVKLKGKADRIDRLDAVLRVIDYKTGKVETADLKTDPSMERMFGEKGDKAFQLMMYAWLYAPQKHDSEGFETGIIALKNHAAYFPLNFAKNDYGITAERLQAFESRLKDLMEEVFDPASDFSQTENKKACEYCDYKFICARE